jgi:hypothetical protein
MPSPGKFLVAVATAAVLSTSVATSAAEAAKPVPKAGATVSAAKIKRAAKVARSMDAGSAGIDGYDDQRCQELLQDMNMAYDRAIEEQDAGNQKAAESYFNLGSRMEHQLTDNCLVVY